MCGLIFSTLNQGNVSVAVCSCSAGLLPPQCDLPVPRLCNLTDALDVPGVNNSCSFCLVPSACAHGGKCYYVGQGSRTAVAVCGCPYGWAPPTCLGVAPPLRLCDPTNPADVPPACEYCRSGQSPGGNGCMNWGFCSLQNTTAPGAAPTSQVPACVCQVKKKS